MKNRDILLKLSYLLFPNRCAVCNKVINMHNYYCHTCFLELRPIPNYFATLYASSNTFITYFKKPYFDGICAPFYHSDGSKQMVYNYKFYNRSEIKHILTDEMANSFNKYLKDKEINCICEVPTKLISIIKRGYNHTALLSKLLSIKCDIPRYKLIKQISKKSVQHKLKAAERLKNVKGVFGFNNKFNIKGKNVVIVDDIFSTGATLNECSKVLKKNGANKVYILTATINRFGD